MQVCKTECEIYFFFTKYISVKFGIFDIFSCITHMKTVVKNTSCMTSSHANKPFFSYCLASSR